MKAAVLNAFGEPLVIQTLPDPVLGTGEVIVDVEILEVNRSRLNQYGIELSNYTVSGTYSPAGNDTSGGLTSVGMKR